MTNYYQDSALLYVFALAAVGGETSKLRNDDDYTLAIEWLVESLRDPQYVLWWHKVIEYGTKTFGVFDEINAYVVEQIVNKDNTRMLLLFRDRLREQNFPQLFAYLEKAAESEWTSLEQSTQLRRLVELLRAQDSVAETAVLLQMLLACQIKVGKSHVMKYITRQMVFRTLLPQAINNRPEDLTQDLLVKLEEFGLIKYVSLELFISTIRTTKSLGDEYERKTSWLSNRPERSDVSGIPYNERLRQWEQKKHLYLDRQIQLSQTLDHLVQLTGAKVIEGEWKDDSLFANIQIIQTLIQATLDHPVTQDILQTELSMPLGLFSYNLREELEQPTNERIKHRLEAMVVLLEFSKRNPARYLTLIKTVIFEFIQTTTLLHGSRVLL